MESSRTTHPLHISGVNEVYAGVVSNPSEEVAGGRELDSVYPATVRVEFCQQGPKLAQSGLVECYSRKVIRFHVCMESEIWNSSRINESGCLLNWIHWFHFDTNFSISKRNKFSLGHPQRSLWFISHFFKRSREDPALEVAGSYSYEMIARMPVYWQDCRAYRLLYVLAYPPTWQKRFYS